MLILSRKLHDEIVVDGPCRIVVMRLGGGKVRLGIVAAPSVNIMRAEKMDRPENRAALPPENDTDEPEYVLPMEPTNAPASTNGTSPTRNPGSPPASAPIIHPKSRHRLRP